MSRLPPQLPSGPAGFWRSAGLGRKDVISSGRLLYPSSLKYCSHVSCVLPCLVFETESPRNPGWPQTLSSALAYPLLGLQVCATMSGYS